MIRLKQLREEKGLKQPDLSRLLNASQQTISAYETGQRDPDTETLIKLSEIFDVSIDYLLGTTNIRNPIPNLELHKADNLIPVIGTISAGEPILAQQNIQGYFPLPYGIKPNGSTYFWLKVKGDSMLDANISNDDLVLIKQQHFLECNGDIMAVIVNGYDATIKHVYKQENGILLKPRNDKYAPLFIPENNTVEVKFVGKVVKILSDPK